MTRTQGVSVIICCYNSTLRLEPTLTHLFKQRISTTINWEIIVVNNNSTDNTVEKAKNLYAQTARDISFRIVEEDKPGLSYARNKGFETAQYDFVLMVDDDNWLSENYVQTVFDDLSENPKAAMVGGLGIAELEGSEPAWFKQYASCYATGPQAEAGDGPIRTSEELYGAGCALKLSVLQQIREHGFTNILSDRTGSNLMSGGDTELCYAFRLAGYDLLYDKRISFNHFLPQGRVNWKYLRKLFFGFGMTKTLMDIYSSAVKNNPIPTDNQRFPHWFNRTWFLLSELPKDAGVLLTGLLSNAEGNHRLLPALARLGQLETTIKFRHQLVDLHQQVETFKSKAQTTAVHQPMVTVLMPVYNAEKYLAEAIESVLGQTYGDFEFLIINDGSTDTSADIIKGYTDDRIRYVINEENIALISTLNKGIAVAKGKYIARMDADDICESNRLETQIRFMEANTDVGVCGSWFQSIGGASNSIAKYPTTDFLIRYTALYQCPFCHPTVMLRTSVLKEHNLLYSKDYPHAEDYEFWLQLSRVTKMANIPESLLQYRLHESNISKTESATQLNLSKKIRGLYFQESGVQVKDEELELFRRLNHQDAAFTLAEINILGLLLESLVTKTAKSSYLQANSLTPLLEEKWLHLCLNHCRFGNAIWQLYTGCSIRYKATENPRAVLRLRVKSWLKR
jgi:glycosyltransferase involved in cell wall biosynthesis